jgi:glycogen debranching enzyme
VQARHINILEGSTFVVSDDRGDLAPDDHLCGLFFRDIRHLSRFQVRLNGRVPDALTADTLEYDEALFYLAEQTGTVYHDPTLSLIRHRFVGDGMVDRLRLGNTGPRPVQVELSVLFGADFADIFEIKDQLSKVGQVAWELADDRVILRYRRGGFRRETVIRAAGAFFTDESLTFRVNLDPEQAWQAEIEVSVATQAARPLPHPSRHPAMQTSLAQWLAGAPRLDTASDDLRRTYRCSLVDLAALRFYPETMPESSLPAAGLPWFMALFGRDSLIASYQTIPFVPELARTTLRALAARQAGDFDDFRDAEPGKILHELRHGELVHFQERPQSPYYGSCDATPLFLIVLDEYERWTGDRQTALDLEPAARAALRWIEEYGDTNGDGYLDYRSRNPTSGLVNQCWKDSWNSIVHPDGRLAELPRATCEVQGYAYDARLRTARLARAVWGDPVLADRLERDAAALRDRFTRDFWLADSGCYALALDGAGQPVRTVTSNPGHLLWSGIVPEEHVDPLVAHLLGPRLYSGWGIRTMASGQAAYNPMEYHNGTVWPHDNSIIAAGLVRYGRRAAAAQVARDLLAAASHFGYRLPEAFLGVDRALTGLPVPYPTACSPQAWASGAPLLLLRCLLGLEPVGDRLRVDPGVPVELGALTLAGIPGRWGRADAST